MMQFVKGQATHIVKAWFIKSAYIVCVLRSVFISLFMSVCGLVMDMSAYANCNFVDKSFRLVSELRSDPGLQGYSIEVETILASMNKDIASLGTFSEAHPQDAKELNSLIETLKRRSEGIAVTEQDIQKYLSVLQNMERFWQCVEPEEINPVENNGSQANSSVQFHSVTSERVQPENPVRAMSEVRNASANRGDLIPAQIARRLPLDVDYLLLAFMALSVLGGFIYLTRRRPKPRARRRIIQAPARVEFNGTVLDIEIVDITVQGCKLSHSKRINRRKRLKVELEGQWHFGQVRWYNDGYAGVKFIKPLKTDLFETIVKSALA